MIAEAFRWSVHRRVTKTGTVSLQANTYQVDPSLAGSRVELVFDPFELAGPVTVNTADGTPAGTAVPLEIGRHVHPKAANAAKDADTGAVNAASGIDYLRLVEDRHKKAMTGTPISFATVTTATGTGEAATATTGAAAAGAGEANTGTTDTGVPA